MPFNGSGTFSRVMDWTNDRDAAIKIRADRHDQNDDDIANGLSNTICRDGQSQITANIPFNGKKITGLANPTDPQDAVTKNYADALRTFNTPIILSGAGANGRLKFTGATGNNGLEWSTPGDGVFFGVNAASGQWVWNDKADATGTDVMMLDPANTTNLHLSSVAAGQTSGPWFRLYRNNPAPAVNDVIGAVGFMGRTSAAGTVEYAGIYATILDPTNNSADGSLIIRTLVNNVATVQMTIADGVTIPKGLNVTGNATATGEVAGATLSSDNLVVSGFSFGTKTLNNYLRLYGGRGDTAANFGANIVLYGPTAAGPNTLELRQGNTTKMSCNSAGVWSVNGNTNITGTLDVSGSVEGNLYTAMSSTGYIVEGFVDGGSSKYNVMLQSTGMYPNPLLLQEVYVPASYVDCRIVMPDVGGGAKTFAFRSDGQAFKNVAGDWAAYSDARIKDVLGDYEGGLAEVRQLQPRRYKLKGNDQPPPLEGAEPPLKNDEPPMPDTLDTVYIGLIAQEAEVPMPETVTQVPGYIDGQWVEDKRVLDTTAVMFALVNSVKELADRLEVLEAA